MSDDVKRRCHESAQEVQDLLGFVDHVQGRSSDLRDGADRAASSARVTDFAPSAVELDDSADFWAAARELAVYLAATQVGSKLNQERHARAVDALDLRQFDLDALHSFHVSQRLTEPLPQRRGVV